MSEPYKITCTLQPRHTRQVGTAPDNIAIAILIIDYSGPVALLEDGVHVGDFETMGKARDAAQQRYEARHKEEWKTIAPGPVPRPIVWITVP